MKTFLAYAITILLSLPILLGKSDRVPASNAGTENMMGEWKGI